MLVVGGYIGLRIKQSQSENREEFLEAIGAVRNEQHRVKEELVGAQNQMRQDMDLKHSENKKEIYSHAASDEQQFKYINQSLDRIEKKVEARNDSQR